MLESRVMAEVEYIKKMIKVIEKYKKDQDKIQKEINKTFDKAQKRINKFKKLFNSATFF